ncbi:hypothetical protein CDAR_619191 [Caerostris darwini]|uniref:Uncharacterized protein n=1 Tax=Caerostris darwini TaxID=1538125 RepID=A0AAV4U2Q9_9ARAC|nr:hypothetical protein CDAR_619191 [Caerostris darwini]
MCRGFPRAGKFQNQDIKTRLAHPARDKPLLISHKFHPGLETLAARFIRHDMVGLNCPLQRQQQKGLKELRRPLSSKLALRESFITRLRVGGFMHQAPNASGKRTTITCRRSVHQWVV